MLVRDGWWFRVGGGGGLGLGLVLGWPLRLGLVVVVAWLVNGSASEELALELELELESEMGRVLGWGWRRRGIGAFRSSCASLIESIHAASGLRLARFCMRIWRCGLLKWLAALPKV